MNTNQLKRFATEARTKLREGIRAKIASLGYNDRGEVPERLRPRPVQGGCILPNGDLETEGYMRQWLLLYDRIQQRGLSEVYEEAAYTWFNRLVAIRIMQRQAEPLCEGVLDFADEARTPRIVDEARMGRLPQMPDEQRQQLLRLLEDDTKVTEQFALLISAWCHQNPILNACFGGMDDYTSLLLPINILSEGGLVDMLNHTDYITESDWLSPELIGWLYQFYISERKDEVFAKKGSVAAEDIPAATQIFTPNWIVKYMVQNTVGRIYLDRNPYAATLKRNWRYLVESEGQERSDAQCWDGNLESLRVADLACGSGHILNECFDLLFDLYTLEGYSRSEAVESIFRNNLTGVDLDTRAKQLATFALLLKACQRDISFADAHCLPNALDMPKPYEEEKDGPFDELIHEFFQGKETVSMISELAAAYRLMKDADSLGSIMKFDITPATRQLIKEQVEYWEREDFIPENVEAQLPAMRLILALTEEYHALVMNPPYMGDGKMNGALSRYVKDNYSIGKTDLFTVFMLLSENRLIEGGRYGMINMQSWMFLSSFEALRRHIIEEQTIENMLHLGPRTFDELPGEVVQNTTFVICKQAPTADACGIYFRLVDGKDCSGKECMFIADEGFYSNIPQSNFEKIPGCPIGYWVSDKMIKAFERISIDQIGEAVQGMIPGNVPEFVRLWFEVKVTKIGFRHIDSSQIIDLGFKWFPYNKGGSMRKWYGNIEHILNMENGG
ncbi:MAG: BREX-1 system adenine-specific DNA-methyltransferase PglX, partial [Bacteroidales bacterium]|nr:BREX-1 system adenine-specific DNA-methyltransferase PglX [Bacteroidales bacterium]